MSLDFESTTDWTPTDWTAVGEDSLDDAITLRRAIHADPELGVDCHRTTAKLKRALEGLPLTIRDSAGTSGFVARLDGTRPGRTVLLRGDMDALPVHEETGLDFASASPADSIRRVTLSHRWPGGSPSSLFSVCW